MNTCSPPGQTWDTPASVDFAAWRCVLAPLCGAGVMMFPGRQDVGICYIQGKLLSAFFYILQKKKKEKKKLLRFFFQLSFDQNMLLA